MRMKNSFNMASFIFTAIIMLHSLAHVYCNKQVTLPSQPKTFELIEGDVLELRCNLDMTGYTITWYFIETILESNESILGINMSSFDQSGKYSCQVSNDSQEVFITFGRR
ncbi:uncharacterized protein [Antedon mediterranea]|uniref:uncharacterized protein n=1 Tax=Antedon mediterranea TaxID=105859 RepID=UPI003AF9B64F